MDDVFKELAGFVALGIEAAAVLLIAFGAFEALFMMLSRLGHGVRGVIHRKEVWVRFGVWLLLGLEFELAADIVRSAIAPTWDDIGQLAAIALIRTVLNYFLEKDIDKYAGTSEAGG